MEKAARATNLSQLVCEVFTCFLIMLFITSLCRSHTPLVSGLYAAVNNNRMLYFLQKFLKMSLVKQLPLSARISRGHECLNITCFSKISIAHSASLRFVGQASIYLVKWSTMTNMCLFL